MDINKFITRTPFLYHLTSIENINRILSERRLQSTSKLIERSQNPAYQQFLNQRRTNHAEILVDNEPVFLRDQKPISEKNLSKCLTDGWTCSDFYVHLNRRVFFWPTVKRLISHFNTYIEENPVIIRVLTNEVLRDNPHVKFCRLNSGATRSNSYLGGKPPDRGINTFLSAENFGFNVPQVAEVTFENECVLNGQVELSKHPTGVFTLV